MRLLHAWDCSCGTRNSPGFTHCRQCYAPAREGRPVAGDVAPSVPLPFFPRASHASAPVIAWGWLLAFGIPVCLYLAIAWLSQDGFMAIFLTLGALAAMWPGWVVVFILYLLVRLVRGVERR